MNCVCGCLRVWTRHGWLCLHCDLGREPRLGRTAGRPDVVLQNPKRQANEAFTVAT